MQSLASSQPKGLSDISFVDAAERGVRRDLHAGHSFQGGGYG